MRHVDGVNISSGAGVVRGAIAAAGSTLTLNRTNLIGNRAAGNAGVVYMSDGSSLICDDACFVGIRAEVDGGAAYVLGH